jgi:threonine dehydrogenase-like Zn-dependent dehydrogenase
MAEHVVVPHATLHEVPGSIDDLSAVMIEPLAAAFQMVEQAEAGPGTRLAVLGDGKLGLLCAWAARLAGARVSLVGKHTAKLALAGPGIETCLLAEAGTLGRPFDVVVEATGSASGLTDALRLVRPRGTVVLKTTIAGRHDIDLAPVVIDEIRLIGSRCGPFPRAIEALATGHIDVRPLVGEVLPLEQAEEAFRAASAPGARKVILHVGEASA